MLDLGTLRLGIKVDSDAAKSELNEVGNEVVETEEKTTSLAATAKTMIKAFAAAWAVKELVKLGKAALEAYAQFEQLEGGVQKIFGDEAAKDVMKNAERAYKTAGISANQYMEQVTSFSASLISSMEGDTVAAAKVADMAIQDMADNANTFGTSIESVQAAYQGFAKGQYTLLDNLKIGYGGTKTEMERLLADAEEISGIKYDISNLDDVYNAIHVIQTELNVTGTTAKEAAKTVEGSVNMMKASWQNLLIAIGRGEGVDTAVDEFLSSLGTVAQNIIPRVIEIAGSVVKGLVAAIPKIMSSLATAISKYADTISSKSAKNFLNAGVKLLGSLVKGILKAAPQLLQAIGKLALSIVKSFANIDLKAAGRAIISSLLSGLTAAWTALKNWVSNKVSWIKEVFSGAKSAGSAPSGATGHRIGLREVPYDGYQAVLHKGEMVLSAAEANQYNKGLNNNIEKVLGGDTITINVYGTSGMNVNDLAAAVERKLINSQNRRRLAWQ